MRLRRLLALTLIVPALTLACSGAGEEASEEAQPELTRAQKDSLIAELPIPGAGAVGSVLDAAAAAACRAEAHDTIR